MIYAETMLKTIPSGYLEHLQYNSNGKLSSLPTEIENLSLSTHRLVYVYPAMDIDR